MLAVAALYLLLSLLALAAFKGREAPASFQQPAQPFYDPEYVSPPPAEVASFSLEAAKIVPLGSSGSKQCFELRMAVSALEYGPFTTGWLAYYPSGYEWVWCCPSFNGPGLVYLNVTSACVEEGYASFGFPLYVSKGGGTAWVQSIDILGSDMPLDKARIIKCLCLPSIRDVAVEEHRDLGGIVIRVTLHAPASWSTFRLRVYCGNRLVYDFMKRVSIPREWESSPIDLRADFGPIRLKKAGTYTIQVDVASGGVTDSRVVTYEKQPEAAPPTGWVTVSVDDRYGASWRVTWSDGASGSMEGKGSSTWSIQTASQVSLWARITGSPTGYTCYITPGFTIAKPGESASFTVSCEKEQPTPSQQPSQQQEEGRRAVTPQPQRSEYPMLYTLLALSIALSAVAVAALVAVLVVLLKRGRTG